ncbi:MAG: Nramp family divalent metal transporter, partial [Acidobacteriota bacterium]
MAARKDKKKSSFGPGFLVTAAFIGPGTVTTCSLAGARFGPTLLYGLLFATAATILLQEMTGRLSLGAKTDLAQSLREFPRSQVTKLIFIILTLSSITFGCMAYEAGNIIGGSLGLEMVTSLPKKIWVLLISGTAFFILNQKRYRIVEKTLMFLVFLMSLSFLTTVIIIRPNLLSVLKGFIPSFPDGSLPLLLALIGTTIVPYNLFLHSSAVKEKWNQSKDLKLMRRDLFYSVSLGGLISTAIIITSSSAYFEKGLLLENGAQMAEQLKPLFGYLTK